MWKEVAQATFPVEWGVKGACKDGFFNAAGYFIALPGEVGDVVWAEVVACDSGLLPNGGCIVIRQR
jgi:hypothetical protein